MFWTSWFGLDNENPTCQLQMSVLVRISRIVDPIVKFIRTELFNILKSLKGTSFTPS